MAPKVKLAETLVVNRIYSEVRKRKSQEVHSDESKTVEVRTFDGVPIATASYRGELTKNLGDFNSAKVSVGVTVPTYLEEIEDALTYASDKVDEALAPALDEFVAYLKDKGLIK